jgi:hypothetical protein
VVVKLTKFTLTDEQFKNFLAWFESHYNYKKEGIHWGIADRFLGHHFGVRMLNWREHTFVTLTPANAGFFILAMSGNNNAYKD